MTDKTQQQTTDDQNSTTDTDNWPESATSQSAIDCQYVDNDYHDENRIVRHIMVIGFHHKHGYQVDYCYPPLIKGGPMFTTAQRPITLPNSWKTLPLLCLPDGSHNYDSDAIYFTMPDIPAYKEPLESDKDQVTGTEKTSVKHKDGIKAIFGTACYRQIHVEKLLHRTDDMTRIAVQKSVCVLSTQPLFGLIRSKLEMITHAYFEELDFSKVRILKLTYRNLNSLLARESIRENATFLGLSARHLVTYFGNNMLVLFKAMLLEKKILFYKSPVKDLCSTIMSMCSLFNGLLECGGLDYSTCDLQLSPSLLEALKLEPHVPESDESNQRRGSRVFFSPTKEEVVILEDCDNQEASGMDDDLTLDNAVIVDDGQDSRCDDCFEPIQDQVSQADTSNYEVINHSITDQNRTLDTPADETVVEDQHAHKLCQLKPQDCGLPLQIFTRGSFCLPYLSISYLDLLSDTRVRSFVIGATNFLFKQRRDMYDVIVDMEEHNIIINNPQLKRILSLSVEDLRFIDYLSKNVKLDMNQSGASSTDQFDPINLGDVTKWVGGDEWIRYHFKIYTLYLLKASRQHNMNQLHRGSSSSNQQQAAIHFVESFNSSFVEAWKCNTNNYRIWEATNKSSVLDKLQLKHPFSSQIRGINFNDMKLKLSYAVNNSEKGRFVSQTLNGIGRWSLWNNIASAGNMAASSIGSTLASSATSAHSAIVNSMTNQQHVARIDENENSDK